MRNEVLHRALKADDAGGEHDDVELMVEEGLGVAEGHICDAHIIGEVGVVAAGGGDDLAVLGEGLGDELSEAAEADHANGEGSGSEGVQFLASDGGEEAGECFFSLFEFFNFASLSLDYHSFLLFIGINVIHGGLETVGIIGVGIVGVTGLRLRAKVGAGVAGGREGSRSGKGQGEE
mmetsp:Transcript_23465/g.34334  ORF Transcript_23465/g.34334 Transcript_23465/m.34334 type:complete len:177 (+) Transcript_23465:936-1466(+)